MNQELDYCCYQLANSVVTSTAWYLLFLKALREEFVTNRVATIDRSLLEDVIDDLIDEQALKAVLCEFVYSYVPGLGKLARQHLLSLGYSREQLKELKQVKKSKAMLEKQLRLLVYSAYKRLVEPVHLNLKELEELVYTHCVPQALEWFEKRGYKVRVN